MFIFFSFLNCSDDLLNYELIDGDGEDIGADEDELLLSDDGNYYY